MTNNHTLKISVGFLILCIFQTACFSSLRKTPLDDLEDEPPVVGGRWSEHGFLSESMGESGYSSYSFSPEEAAARGLAQVGAKGEPSDSWVNEEQQYANRQIAGVQGDGNEEEQRVLHSGPGGISNLIPNVKRNYKNGMRATRDDFVDAVPNDGSLWGSNGQTNYYFSKNKVRAVGDLVTVNVEQDLVRDMGLEVRRGLSPREKEKELKLAEDRVRARVMAYEAKQGGGDKVSSSAAAPQRAPAADGKTQSAEVEPVSPDQIGEVTLSDVDVARSLEVKPGDQMMGEIIERYPNGNYKIRAVKKVPYRNGATRLVQLIGVAKGSDIAEDDTLSSGKLYEYRIQALR